MRDAYIRKKGNAQRGTMRGGVGYGTEGRSDAWEDYELEIGENSNCSIAMLSLCVHHDEIMQYIEQQNDPLGKLLLQSMRRKEQELTAMSIDNEVIDNVR